MASKDKSVPWAANVADETGYRVVIEDPARFPFVPGEEDEYHEATDDEYAAYEEYWDKFYAEEG